MVERSVHIGKAAGSIPAGSTKNPMELTKLLLTLTIVSIIPGQLIRINATQSAVLTVGDISSAILMAVFFINSTNIKKALILPKKIFLPFLIFSSVAISSTIIAADIFSPREIIIAILFLVRFALYFGIFIVVVNTVKKKEITKWLNLFLFTAAIFALIGFFQYIFFPDLTSLAAFGWDPHQKRIVSTLLDPNFTAGLLAIALSMALSLFLSSKKNIYLLTSTVLFTSLILTFSRSGYLALLVVLATIGILKSPKILFVSLVAFIIAFITIPQVKNRILGALRVDETSQARIESWQKALVIFRDNPILGVGFNTYRATQAQYGFFPADQPEGGHSGAGTDSSFLLVLATTGIIGLGAYLAFLFAIFKNFSANIRKSPLSLGTTAAFLGILVHSQFVNSLFFPQIIIVLFFLLGACSVYDS